MAATGRDHHLFCGLVSLEFISFDHFPKLKIFRNSRYYKFQGSSMPGGEASRLARRFSSGSNLSIHSRKTVLIERKHEEFNILPRKLLLYQE